VRLISGEGMRSGRQGPAPGTKQRPSPDARAALVTQRLRELAGENGWWERDGVKTRLAAAEAACEAARILVYQAIDARAKSRPEDLAVNMARVAIVRCERIVAELALELFEGESLELGSIGNSQLKTSMIAGLGGGSVEVQLNGIARSLLGPNER